MTKSATSQRHLRIYTEQPPKNIRPQIEAVACMPELARAFQAVTGFGLRNESGKLHVEEQPSEIATDASFANPQSPSRDAAERLAGSIADLLGELMQTRRALWQREAELAAGVPLVPHREEERHLAERLQSVLRSGVEAIGCDAGSLYLLDEATTELKMRSSWGLPFDRLTAPARPLQGALADLEALLGHAVVLDDPETMQMWNIPEQYPAAVCVPVSTPTTLLGTLWIFSKQQRDFNDRETNLLEIIAGRIASDLEREMLMRAGVDGQKLQKQLAAAERLQHNQLPTISPLLDQWDVAGWTSQAGGVGGAFHDWFCLPRGLLATSLGRSTDQGMAGAMTANVVKTAVRAHARYQHQTERLLQQVNLTLWTGSAGDQHASLFCGLIETSTGRVCCSSAGSLSALWLHADGWQSLAANAPRLGESPETTFEQFGQELQPGELLLVFSDTLRDAFDPQKRALGEQAVAEALRGKLDRPAEEIIAAVREQLTTHAVDCSSRDWTVLAIKRTG
ncbi:MAG: SpoIIE family protein phosphatase [Planctomycetaceae bacterium]|nr:SpoIIE family protein phosphatase [Planctomycetaceae bacterium]